MTQVRDAHKKYCSRALLAAASIAVVFLLFGRAAVARGLILGALFSILNFTLLACSLPLQLNKGRRKTFLFCFSSIGMRYLLMALPIFIAAGSERFSIFGVAAGLFMVQAVILFHQLGPGFAEQAARKNNSPASLSGRGNLRR